MDSHQGPGPSSNLNSKVPPTGAKASVGSRGINSNPQQFSLKTHERMEQSDSVMPTFPSGPSDSVTNLMSKLNSRLLNEENGRENGLAGSELSLSLNEAIEKVHGEGGFGEPSRGVGSIVYQRNNLDFNDYKPIQRIPLSDRPINIVTLNHELGKNIVGIQFNYRVAIYEIEHKKTEKDEHFTLTKLQQVDANDPVFLLDRVGMVSAFSVSSSSSLASPVTKRLTYAFSVVDYPVIYLVDQSTNDKFAPKLSSSDPGIFKLKGHAKDVRYFAFDAVNGEFLASLADDCTCIVWRLDTKKIHCTFELQSFGSSCMWHSAEPYKLLVVEQEGKIRMINILKKCVVVTINTLVQPIYSADWSITNSSAVGVGTLKAAYFFDITKLNSQPGRKVETHQGATNFVKFSTTDDQMFASASCYPRGEIKVYQKSFLNYVWSQKRDSIQTISWLFGEPFLLAGSKQDLLIYESTLL